jgi:hypothetical protein
MSPLARRSLDVVERSEDLVRFMGVAPVPAGPTCSSGERSDWILLDATIDPHVQTGTLAMPKTARRHLDRVLRSGAEFDRIVIGHEMAAGTIAGLEGKPMTAADAARVVGAPTEDRRARQLVECSTAVMKALATGLAGVALAGTVVAASPLLLLGAFLPDPVILGAVSESGKAEPGELAAWFHIVDWT